MKKIKYLIFPILLLISFSVTYAIFSSSKSGSGNVSAANWLVKLETIDDEIDITGGRQNINFGLCEKFMPGNPCVLPLNIDATNTDVDTVVTLEIGEVVGATKKELDAAGVSFKISDGVNEGYSYNVGYRTKKNLNLVIDWELGNINDVEKTNADLNLSKIQNNITVPVSIIVRQALNTPRTVTFNTHVDRISNPSSIEVIEGLTISNIPVIQDNEYEFEGWYTKEKGGVKLTNNTIITDDIEYHAHYSNIRAITFNSYGGSNIDDIEVLSGNTISNLPTPIKFGYTFNGWYTNIVGGEQLTSSTEITSDRTYYAHWVTKYYTLTFDSDGSSVNPIQVQEGESLSSSNISMPTSEKQGYDLVGWFNNSEELTINTQILSDLTYTASWTPNTYTVTFDYDGATGNNTTTSKTVTYDSTYGSLPEPTKEGYTFMGWNGKNLFNVNVPSGSASSTTYEDTTQRKFSPNTYLVGLAFDNYYNPALVPSMNITNNSINLVASYGYGVGYPLLLDKNKTYTLSYNAVINGSDASPSVYSSIIFYKEDGTRISYKSVDGAGDKVNTFTTPSDAYYTVIDFALGGVNTSTTFSNIQLEEGSSATFYEPYYIESTTVMKWLGNHTLKAMWEEKTDLMNFSTRTLGNPSDITSSNTTKRTWDTNIYAVGLSSNNYYYPSWVSNYSVASNKISVTSACGYGVAFPMRLEAGKTYDITYTSRSGNYMQLEIMYYQSDGTYIGSYDLISNPSFTVPSNAYYTLVDVIGNGINCSDQVEGTVDNPKITLAD